MTVSWKTLVSKYQDDANRLEDCTQVDIDPLGSMSVIHLGDDNNAVSEYFFRDWEVMEMREEFERMLPLEFRQEVDFVDYIRVTSQNW